MEKLRSGDFIKRENVPLGGSPENPVPLRAMIKTRIEHGMGNSPETYDLQITVLDVLRGKEAGDRVMSLSAVEKPVNPNYDFVPCRIKLGYFRRGIGSSGSTVPYEVTKDQFSAFSADGTTDYPVPSISVKPDLALIGKVLSSGESLEGWIILEVPKNEEKPLLAFNREKINGVYWVWGYVWLSLH